MLPSYGVGIHAVSKNRSEVKGRENFGAFLGLSKLSNCHCLELISWYSRIHIRNTWHCYKKKYLI